MADEALFDEKNTKFIYGGGNLIVLGVPCKIAKTPCDVKKYLHKKLKIRNIHHGFVRFIWWTDHTEDGDFARCGYDIFLKGGKGAMPCWIVEADIDDSRT